MTTPNPRLDDGLMRLHYAGVLGLVLGFLCFEQRETPTEERAWIIAHIRQAYDGPNLS